MTAGSKSIHKIKATIVFFKAANLQKALLISNKSPFLDTVAGSLTADADEEEIKSRIKYCLKIWARNTK